MFITYILYIRREYIVIVDKNILENLITYYHNIWMWSCKLFTLKTLKTI